MKLLLPPQLFLAPVFPPSDDFEHEKLFKKRQFQKSGISLTRSHAADAGRGGFAAAFIGQGGFLFSLQRDSAAPSASFRKNPNFLRVLRARVVVVVLGVFLVSKRWASQARPGATDC